MSVVFTEKYEVETVIELGSNGHVAVMETWMIDGRPHRIAGPAYIERDPDTGVVTAERWCCHDVAHREDGPAEIGRDGATGQTITENWYCDGRRHRDGEPAQIVYDETGKIAWVRWFVHGREVNPGYEIETLREPPEEIDPEP